MPKDPPKYPEDSVGREMVERIPLLREETSIYGALSYLTKHASSLGTINYLYVTDPDRKLKGVVPIKKLFENAKDRGEKKVSSILTKDLITVEPETSQEYTAHLALEHKLKSIPVVEKDGTLIGIFPNEKILSTMYEEKVEDLLKFAGIRDNDPDLDDVMTMPIWISIEKRFVWLLLGTLGGILMAETITFFEATLHKNILIAAFIPLMVYMSNAVGQQISAFIIRDSVKSFSINYLKYFWRHLAAAGGVGILLGLVISAYTYVVYTDPQLSLVLGLSVFATIISAIFSGFLIPYFFIKIKKDPANASGPISTIIQDIVSVIIYFVIASGLL